MKKISLSMKPRACVLCAAAALMLAGTAHAQSVISFSFDNDAAAMEATDLAGADSRVGNWNNWGKVSDLSAGSIIDDSGATVAGMAATVTTTSRSSRDNLNVNDEALFSDVIDIQTSTTVSVSGISFDTYDVYVYMRDDGSDRSGSFNIGSTTYFLRGGVGNPDSTGAGYLLSTDTIGGSTIADVDQGNYAVFSGLTGSSFDLDAAAAGLDGGLARNKFAGFQIVQVPEPGTYAMLAGLGALSYVAVRRRK